MFSSPKLWECCAHLQVTLGSWEPALSILPTPKEIALCIFLWWHIINTSDVMFSSYISSRWLSTMKAPALSLSQPSSAVNLLNVVGVPITGMGTGLSTSPSPTESACWLRWKQVLDFTEEECCRLCQLINDPYNEYLELPLFQLNWKKKKKERKVLSKSRVPLFHEGTTQLSPPIPFRVPSTRLHVVYYSQDSTANLEERTVAQCPRCLAPVSRVCNRDGLWAPKRCRYL